MAFDSRTSLLSISVPTKCERGFISSPADQKSTFNIPADLRPPPPKTKYRSPNSSANESPRQRSHTPFAGVATGKCEKENTGNRLSAGRGHSNGRTLRDANSSVPKLVLPSSKTHGRVGVSESSIDPEDAGIRGKETDASKMDDIIKRYKREIVDQTHKMQEFRRNMVDYDVNLKHLLTTVAEEKHQKKMDILLMEKTREIEELKALLQRRPDLTDRKEEVEALKLQVKEMAAEILGLKSQITQQQSDSEVLEVVTKERDDLKRQLSAPQTLTEQDYQDLASTIKDLEDMQNRLMRENNELKEELIKEQRRNLNTASKDIHYAQKDLSQLTHLLESLRSGGEVNLNFLLGAGGRETETGLELMDEVEKLKDQLSNVKLLVSDLYAEHCGSRCSLQ